MLTLMVKLAAVPCFFACVLTAQIPGPVQGGYALPNGWKITPAGKAAGTEDLLLNLSASPDGRALVALHGGFNPHGLVVLDPERHTVQQRIGLKSAWLGLAWSPDGKRLFVSGGNANGRKTSRAPVYVFNYANGKLGAQAAALLEDHSVSEADVYWSGLAHHPNRLILYAADRSAKLTAGAVAVFDTSAMKPLRRIRVEMSPYDLALSPDGSTLYVSNWSSGSVSVVDTLAERVAGTIAVGSNPNDLELAPDGRLFVSCANDNAVYVIDTKSRLVLEKINTALSARAPTGATPNALKYNPATKTLFVANADNNSVAVVDAAKPGESVVRGFIPAAWYPSALEIAGGALFIGNSKGLGGYANPMGPNSPLRKSQPTVRDAAAGPSDAALIPGTAVAGNTPADERPDLDQSVKSLQKGSVHRIPLSQIDSNLRAWTRAVFDNCPYKDEYLTLARAPKSPSIVPRTVGEGSPIKHVLYIIKENRTYDQVFGDIPKGNGDPRLTLFGRDVTPNQHALAEEFVLFDNLYCDGEVSVDGHSWSNSAYATDFNEKFWPANYGGHSKADPQPAYVPSSGHLWDQARKKGLTVRTYGEYVRYSPEEKRMVAIERVPGLYGHVSPDFKKPGMRDTDNAKVFIRELEEFDHNFASGDPNMRLPNFMVMSLAENHTVGTRPGALSPRSMVASNDLAVGMIVERMMQSPYWPETAVFIIEDDAQNGPDHVDARRTVGLVISPYAKRGIVDSTLYSTSSMLRTMELLLGLSPMTQYDAAATPMYAALGTEKNLKPWTRLEPRISLNERNPSNAYGARRSMGMDFSEVDLIPMDELNEILWKSIKGVDSVMPPPVRAFSFTQMGR